MSAAGWFWWGATFGVDAGIEESGVREWLYALQLEKIVRPCGHAPSSHGHRGKQQSILWEYLL